MTRQQYHSNGTDAESDSIDWEKAQRATRMLLEAVGEDPDRDGLKDTWERRVPAAFKTLTEGNRDAEKPDMRTFVAETNDLVIKTGIPVYSLCEHHILPYHGVAHIAYRPDGDIVGLSKLARYVRWRSRRLTVQEGLTADIAEGLADEVDAEAVRVELTATHLCEAMRGVETASETTTQSTVGELTENERRRFRSAVDSHE
ncbi:GTP cyclohydrolase I FolE [Natronomonas sp. CBA1123]|jgi:GTP cyclohydrolase I|uniref:GTP cyclohydrolase I n=1 Tax=Natronomonas sp. CBA1123 TaxID=2668070 RepID=UPI0012EA0CC6|nr:GTP cyclohydrolase I [Natronomonas sp. CBA1123]MUV85306.1 GTP cyclohydrolase I FolE [Natronomonas sp. CBA1123]